MIFHNSPFVSAGKCAGQLVELYSDRAFGVYYIVTRPGVLRRPVKTFVKWLKRRVTTETAIRPNKRKPRRG
jgi:hypothetical protein